MQLRPQDVDPVELAAVISTLPPTHPLVSAARAGVDISDGRAEQGRAHVEASRDVAEGWQEQGMPEQVARDQDMWTARSRAARGSAEAARAEAGDTPTAVGAGRAEEAAGRADREAERAQDHTAPLVPEPRSPATGEYRPETAWAVAEARRWVAEQEEAEHERWDYAYDFGHHAEQDAAADGEAAERVAGRAG